MKWPVFGIAAYVALAAQLGLAKNLGIPTDHGHLEPRFVLLLAVFVGMWTPPQMSMVAWAILGLCLDLTTAWPTRVTDGSNELPEAMRLIGPYTLGYLAGAFVLTTFRPVMLGKHPLALAAMAGLTGMAVHLVVVGVFSIRLWYDNPQPAMDPWSQLVLRMGCVLYTAMAGLILAIPMNMTGRLFGFEFGKSGSGKALRV